MEATAVSLTRTVLDGVLGGAGTAMADEAALLLGVRREVDFIRRELQMMQSFLSVQSSAGAGCNDTVKTCVKHVRDLACDLEDCLLDFTMHAARAPWLRWGPGIATRHRVAGRIRDLKASLVELNQRNQRYNVFVADKATPAAAADEHGHADDDFQLSPGNGHQDIQRAGEMKHLADLVKREGATVVSVWGMGGMGKSSLVRMLYDDTDLIDDFDGRAWVTVPHPLDCTKELERRLRKQLGLKSTDLGVPAWLKKKRCLVVVDDVSSHEEWELLSRCLGVGGANGTGTRSRVVVTTRREDVARRCAGDDRDVLQNVYELMPLKEEEARKLLCRKVYKNADHTMTEDMLTQGNLILKRCREGYITKPRDMSIEEVGRMYYNELISRSMIQPSEKARASMGVERCRVHGVVLQIILSKAIEENQLFIMDKHCNEAPQSKIRHLVVTRWKNNEEKMASINLSQVRSLTIFGKCPISLISSKLRLLRVLDLEDTAELENDDLKHIGELYHLRYLGLRKTNISRLPSSLENLRYLETLDVQDTKVTKLPVGITKMEKLRHLVGGVNFARDLVEKTKKNKDICQCNDNFFDIMADLVTGCHGYKNVESPCSCCAQGFSVTTSERIDKLRNLQVLGVVHIAGDSKVARNLGKLTSLRRLGIDVAGTGEVREDLCSSISRLVRLERLEVRSDSLEFLKESPPKHLTSLRLSGRLGKLPDWMKSLKDLGKVKLLQTQLKQVDIDVMGNLPNLTLLALWEGSFAHGSLCFSEGTFQKLKQLYIEGLEITKTIEIEEGTLPVLEKLEVKKCVNLDDSEVGLSHVVFLKNLNELVLTSCGDKPQLEKSLQRQISGFELAKRPKLITGKSIVTRSLTM
ncbi:unnamed protein product [Alopecurus aequalis]